MPIPRDAGLPAAASARRAHRRPRANGAARPAWLGATATWRVASHAAQAGVPEQQGGEAAGPALDGGQRGAGQRCLTSATCRHAASHARKLGSGSPPTVPLAAGGRLATPLLVAASCSTHGSAAGTLAGAIPWAARATCKATRPAAPHLAGGDGTATRLASTAGAWRVAATVQTAAAAAQLAGTAAALGMEALLHCNLCFSSGALVGTHATATGWPCVKVAISSFTGRLGSRDCRTKTQPSPLSMVIRCQASRSSLDRSSKRYK